MPLTNASSPSMEIVFSWWQWNGCSRGSHLALDARAARERAHGLLHLRARGVKGRHRRAGPHEHAHVDALGQLGEQRADDDRRLAADELEVRRQVPAGDVHEVARALHRLGDGGQRLRAVDEDVERAALARRRIAGGPQAVVGRLQRPLPPQAPQAAAVLDRHGGLDRVADGGVGAADGEGWPWVRSCPMRGGATPCGRSRRCAARASREGSVAAARPLVVVLGRPARRAANWRVGARLHDEWRSLSAICRQTHLSAR